jgi:hypothetical protein
MNMVLYAGNAAIDSDDRADDQIVNLWLECGPCKLANVELSLDAIPALLRPGEDNPPPILDGFRLQPQVRTL